MSVSSNTIIGTLYMLPRFSPYFTADLVFVFSPSGWRARSSLLRKINRLVKCFGARDDLSPTNFRKQSNFFFFFSPLELILRGN